MESDGLDRSQGTRRANGNNIPFLKTYINNNYYTLHTETSISAVSAGYLPSSSSSSSLSEPESSRGRGFDWRTTNQNVHQFTTTQLYYAICTLTPSSSLWPALCCCCLKLFVAVGAALWLICLDLLLLLPPLPLFIRRSISESLSLSSGESWILRRLSSFLSSCSKLQNGWGFRSMTSRGSLSLHSKPLSPISVFTALIRPILAESVRYRVKDYFGAENSCKYSYRNDWHTRCIAVNRDIEFSKGYTVDMLLLGGAWS